MHKQHKHKEAIQELGMWLGVSRRQPLEQLGMSPCLCWDVSWSMRCGRSRPVAFVADIEHILRGDMFHS